MKFTKDFRVGKRVCHITTVHQANDVRIFHKECSSLAKEGYEVFFLVANGKSAVLNDVQIVGVDIPVRNRVQRIRKTSKVLLDKAIDIDADIYHFHDPEFLQSARKLQRAGKKVIYDVHEDVPRQILAKSWIPRFLRRGVSMIFEKYESSVASSMDAIVAATPFIRDRFLKINQESISVNNYPIVSAEKVEANTPKENAVCYVGGLDKDRGITELVLAMGGTNVKLNLAGRYSPSTYVDELEKLVGWSNVEDFGFVEREEVKSILNRSLAGIVTLKPLVNYLDSLPVKMFEYMEAGIPVIASDFPFWKSIISECDCGVCVDPLDVNQISAAILEMVENPRRAAEMGGNGRKAIEEKFNWQNEEKKLVELYAKLG